ncbi:MULTISPECIES: WecB/TagA/CpsF family glycosyltransferase [Cryobacterium]|uniref:Exopolysaccharide biosynthesis protein n=1 Tax=Cryobacterium zongtaii TaxID=1259217 RepID=A0A2S3ZC20_9MICO|nr:MULTISPECIES: WecB/TagA/CpsF family glycosyltransferase [Cryobacterium]POH63429.1 exopolysaccharide biosynthesis protein [Cryobacterium zongtaii]POH66777.1 exopolysaccharide biosynthesis protein [Cryobacterium zongtaii]TFC42424.1 WecB/TagA/CpsF family glycosyltransferase [Cryobacterium sp. TMN-39-2]
MTLDTARIVLGGSAVDLLEFSDSMERITEHLEAPDIPPLAVTSINLDHVHHFGAGADWSGTLDDDVPAPEAGHSQLTWLNLIDGAPLAAQAGRITGRAWPRLAGSDLIGPILALCESRGTRIGFLGGTADTHDRLLAELAARYPALCVAGLWAPARDELNDSVRSEAIAREIRDADTELLIVGLGKPRQELWIAEHGLATGSRVLLAFGAVVDFLAGRVTRAPHWISAHGLEWAWRLALEPRRLCTRYLVQGPPAYLAVRRRESIAAPWTPSPAVIGVHPHDGATENRFVGFADPDEHADVAVVVVADSTVSVLPLLEELRAECQDLRLRCIVTGGDPGRTSRPELLLQRDVILVPTERNRGHAASINAARAHIGRADAVLVLDGTGEVERGALRTMVDRMNRAGAGAVVPRLLTGDGATRRHLPKEPTVSRALLGATVEKDDSGSGGRFSSVYTDAESYEHAHQVRWGFDTGLLVRRDVDDLVGDRDERFTAAQESDYFRRVRETGAPIWYEPAARIRSEASPGVRPPALAALLAANQVRFTRRYRSFGYALAFQAALAVTAARHWTDPAQRTIVRTLLTGSAWRTAPAAPPKPVAVTTTEPGPWGRSATPAGTIIIPAHNERATIGRTLALIAPMAALNQAEIIVVCNGCSDSTASVARRFPGVAVYDIETASKTAALNVGDAAAHAWPRLYLDADVAIEPTTVRAIFDSLGTGRILAARPEYTYDTTGASALVKSYYRARRRIPTNRDAVWGAGAYALNASGHGRFDRFPDVTADDSYVDSLFRSDEKVVVPTGSPVRVFTPRTVASLVAVLARQYRGVSELGTESTTAGSIRSLVASVRGPASAADVVCYGLLTVLGRLRAHRVVSRGRAGWERDLSSRALPPDLAA